jgi:hypothetical protein
MTGTHSLLAVPLNTASVGRRVGREQSGRLHDRGASRLGPVLAMARLVRATYSRAVLVEVARTSQAMTLAKALNPPPIGASPRTVTLCPQASDVMRSNAVALQSGALHGLHGDAPLATGG